MKTYIRKIDKHGRLTIPKAIMKELGWKPGDSINIEVDEKRGVIVLTKVDPC